MPRTAVGSGLARQFGRCVDASFAPSMAATIVCLPLGPRLVDEPLSFRPTPERHRSCRTWVVFSMVNR